MVIRHGGLTAAERVKKAVEVCKQQCSPYCPYWTEDECRTLILTDCAEAIAERDERIAIMQESMEAMEVQNRPKPVDHIVLSGLHYYQCPKCHFHLLQSVNHRACGQCGQAVKWE